MRWRWPPLKACGIAAQLLARQAAFLGDLDHALVERLAVQLLRLAALAISGSEMMSRTVMRGLSEE